MPHKTVFVFGAGASKADGLPTQAELFKKYFSLGVKDSFTALLKEYFNDFFGIADVSSKDNKWPSFEESLAMVEIAMDKEHAFGPTYPTEKLREIRNGLIILMGRAIEMCWFSENWTTADCH